MSTRALALVLGVVFAPEGCRKTEDSSPAPARPEEPAPAPASPDDDVASTTPTQPTERTELDDPDAVAAYMQQHFEEVSQIKEAVIDGDVEAAREQAEALAARAGQAAPPQAWKPHLEPFSKATEAARTANDLAAAAKSVGRLAAACGGCHRALEAKPVFDAPPEPEAEDEDSVRADMERHQWAADRMWEGMVAPSEHAWSEGTRVFGEAVGCPQGADPEVYPPELCRRVHALGRRAKKTQELAARGEVYGEFLQTCAECHRAVDAPVQP